MKPMKNENQPALFTKEEAMAINEEGEGVEEGNGE